MEQRRHLRFSDQSDAGNSPEAGDHAEFTRGMDLGASAHSEVPVADADERDRAGNRRDQAAAARDRLAAARDEVGDRRDDAADRRDQAAEQGEHDALQATSWECKDPMADAVVRSGAARREAASDRVQAWRDRRAGANERSLAVSDRHSASADRWASAREREYSSIDDLTGAYLRGPGLVELKREMSRARRMEQPFVLAFVDVDGLKTVNDSGGHAAGDRMLMEVATILRSHLRDHDLIVRYGGDEFICALSGLDMAESMTRMALVHSALAAGTEAASVTVGLAELRQDDAPEDLVARADLELYHERRGKAARLGNSQSP
jgi:diguanylate cyclase (GGDEF)-like protein